MPGDTGSKLSTSVKVPNSGSFLVEPRLDATLEEELEITELLREELLDNELLELTIIEDELELDEVLELELLLATVPLVYCSIQS